jgi:hypothetical protein
VGKPLRSFVAGSLVAVLSNFSSLLAVPPARPAPALGVITQAQRANAGNASAMTGSTIFDGDLLQTDKDGSLRVRIGSAQLYLFDGGEVVLYRSGDGFSADLSRGGVVLSSGQGQTFHLLADGASIQPGTSQPTVAQVTWVSPKELVVISRKGTLQILMGDETQTVGEGAAYRMAIDPPAAAAASMPRTPKTTPSGHNRFHLFLVATAVVAVAVGTFLAIESPHSP